MTVADLTGDGIPDLIYADYVTGNVAVRLGNGNGTFGPAQTFPDRSRRLSGRGGGLERRRQARPRRRQRRRQRRERAAGQRQRHVPARQKSTTVGSNPYTLAVADFNGDGIPDVVTANRGDNTVSVLLGNGDGTFEPQETFPTGTTPRAVAVGDFNGDGQVDIVTANLGDDTASVLLGNGDGTFSFGAQQSAPAAPWPRSRSWWPT